MPFTQETTAGESLKDILDGYAVDINTETSFIATVSGSELDISGLTTNNTFEANFNDIGLGFSESLTAVPEASTWAMMGIGFAALGYMAYARSRKDRVALSTA